MHVKIYTDGAARGNPDGPGGYGTVLEYVDRKGRITYKRTVRWLQKDNEQPDGADGGDQRIGSAEPSVQR